ncbi:formimidoylglutamase [Tenacibaculum finnmarkense]|uniref:Arginase n=1 Tax=Tenacibaculum finnmarkense genomovar finnmarkense TaxID=1458503 RepID=A0AAP1WFJ8_9FLAO|nr:formimidoylglutamase [Tenacibaculum finnmarkense]MBE7651914.1 arginase [Tenacibaculum finnmarkense genomovar finnmarkense]MBE7694371.1 arginase [Tenacibaculum finnmarkense genomovar finnmarkense]MCD8426130.1 formimidoylglutamase [Tenacibaculum finnmarkense genomovar finnmarkense]MCG8729923.1 formimidoylglutamase [Tenacibaculum finnmarkense]MCG8751604.1 formimidoylglutamase [Tenacibaculum finnmarkense]
MDFNFFIPIKDTLVAHLMSQSMKSLGRNIAIHTKANGLPDLSGVTIAIIGIKDGRGAPDNEGCGENLEAIREKLYKLFPGNWQTKIADLGNIAQGNTLKDTYFAVSSSIEYLLSKKIIPILIGGSQDMTYANYRGYDSLGQTVNLVSVDSKFDLGAMNESFRSSSFLSKIIMDQPNNLFNYSNIGYQTYFNSQEEIELLDKLYFDAFRLGEVKDVKLVEPIMRDADIVSIDIGAVRQSEAPANKNASPNGFYGEEICAITRYAGISDKVTSFGVYEYNSLFDSNNQTASLIAQMIWFFIEGVNARANDYPFVSKDNYHKFTVLLADDDPINFYKSDKTGRWWMEINMISNTKHKRHALVPCNYKDYEQALKGKMPDRWYKALQKLV